MNTTFYAVETVFLSILVLMTLRYLGKGDFLSEVGDIHGCHKSTVSRSLWEVIGSINRHLDNIRFPISREELNITKQNFFKIARMPGVIGAIDGTLIPIVAPSEHEYAFVCRKGFHALNVQAVASYDMRFTDCVCRWPGSQHDAWIFNNCALREHLEETQPGHLLGDSGYALKPYLLTPKAGANDPSEVRYNTAHRRTRVVVERAFGLLKSRFRCLHKSGGAMQLSPPRSAAVVEACMRLHNMCISYRLAPPQDTENVNNVCDNMVLEGGDNDQTGNQRRQLIINLF